MYGTELHYGSFWWIIPLFMMILCFLTMRKRRGSVICGFRTRGIGNYQFKDSVTAAEILDKRYASGEINKDEYEEIKKAIVKSTNETLE